MAEGVIDLNGNSYEEATKSGVVLVDFWAPWCGPCKMQGPILEKVAAEIGDKAVIAKVNVDESPELAAKYGIRSIPTLILLKDGESKQQFVGLQQQAALVSAISAEL
ncbi:MAG: thioredoxin [Pontiellaceae bacterium]|nr:thioredoxin [Pontiellaceae bacterium]MBN2784469.1 thioredoxin [Pontiellaceae bacterium]